MRYKANPVEVEAHRIVSVGPLIAPENSIGCDLRHLALENGENVAAHEGMLARMTPVAGDYWVIQQDGYVYLNPKEVFERKYSPALPGGIDAVITEDGTVIGAPLLDLSNIR